MSHKNEIFEFIKNTIVDMKDMDDDDELTLDTSLESLELDSLDYIEVQVSVKKRYAVDLVADLFVSGKITNIEQLVDYVASESQVALEA